MWSKKHTDQEKDKKEEDNQDKGKHLSENCNSELLENVEVKAPAFEPPNSIPSSSTESGVSKKIAQTKLNASINKSTAIIAKLAQLKGVGMLTPELAAPLNVERSQLKQATEQWTPARR